MPLRPPRHLPVFSTPHPVSVGLSEKTVAGQRWDHQIKGVTLVAAVLLGFRQWADHIEKLHDGIPATHALAVAAEH